LIKWHRLDLFLHAIYARIRQIRDVPAADKFPIVLWSIRSRYVFPPPFKVPTSHLTSQGWPSHKRLCKIYQQSPPPSIDGYCGLCGKTKNLTTTDCCGRAICDDVGAYKPFTYSNVSCFRNHSRYTMCAYHYKESHGSGKWQDCQKCSDGTRRVEDLVHKGTSSFNFLEDKWETASMFEPTKCVGCKRAVKLGPEGHGMVPDGVKCMNCVGSFHGLR
jgi:hypothetical protein